MQSLNVISRTSRSASLWRWLQSELTPFPGRSQTVIRFLLCSAIVIFTSMALQLPYLSLSLIIVFFTAQENTILTRMSGIVQAIGATVAIVLSLLLLKFSIDNPMLRLGGACFLAFCGMYFMRVSKFGTAGYLVAMVVFYAQSFADFYDSPEVITRALLWVWVAVTYPVVITIAINLLLFPPHPERLLNREIIRQVAEVRRQLEARLQQRAIPNLPLVAVEYGIQQLHRHLTFAARAEVAVEREQARYLMRITAVDRLHTAAAHLAQLPAQSLNAHQQARVRQLIQACQSVELAVIEGTRFVHPESLHLGGTWNFPIDVVLREMVLALQVFASADVVSTELEEGRAVVKLKADAQSIFNPAYAQFAAKTVLAATLSYVLYIGLQWPGIHTAMLTCFILSLPSLGASAHKSLTRVVGCGVGSVIALLATVFITPHLESITGLLLMTLPVIALAAWIAAGSTRSNYIGIQIMFAYALALLGQFSPVTDLTEIRDRMIGILIGVSIYLLISANLWPEREGDDLRRSLSALLRSIGSLASADCVEHDRARVKGWVILRHNREIQGRVALEPGWQYAHESVTPNLTIWLALAQETLFAVNWLQSVARHQDGSPDIPLDIALEHFKRSVSYVLNEMASIVLQQHAAGSALSELNQALTELEDLCMPTGIVDGSSHPGHTLIVAARRVYEQIEQLQGGLMPVPT